MLGVNAAHVSLTARVSSFVLWRWWRAIDQLAHIAMSIAIPAKIFERAVPCRVTAERPDQAGLRVAGNIRQQKLSAFANSANSLAARSPFHFLTLRFITVTTRRA